MMTLITVLLVAAGAAWRVWDGYGHGPGGGRVAVGAVVALMVAAWGVLPEDLLGWVVAVLVAAAAMWAMVRSYDDWSSWRNLYQYWPASIGAVIATAHSLDVVVGLVYLGLLVVAGAAHPLTPRLPLPHATRWAEGVAGGCVIGGMVVL